MVDEFYGDGCSGKDRKLKKDICLWLMNRRRGIKLNDEQKEVLWYIRQNMSAGAY